MEFYNSDGQDKNENIAYDYYANQLKELIGENVSLDELEENYGITMKEYLNPTSDTIEKVKLSLDVQEAIKRR